MATVQDNLTDLITCDVCYNVFDGRDPRLLPCGHSFCISCIKDIHQTASKNKNNKLKADEFRCPVCQDISHIPANFGYPKYFQANQMLDILNKLGKDASPNTDKVRLCLSCGKNDAEAYCFNCVKAMCDCCLQAHGKNRRYAGHAALKVSRDHLKSLVCTDHDQFIEAYCAKCSKVACAQCQLTNHSGHDIQDFIITKSSSDSNLVSEIDVRRESFRKKLLCLNQMEDELGDHVDILHGKVTQHKDLMIAHIEQQENMLHKKLDDHKREVCNGIRTMRNNIIEANDRMEKIRNQIFAIVKPMDELADVHLENANELISELKQSIPVGPFRLESFMKFHFEQSSVDRVQFGTLKELSYQLEREVQRKVVQDDIKPTPSGSPMITRPAPPVCKRIFAGNSIQAAEWMPNGEIIVVADNNLKMFNVQGMSKSLPFDNPDTTCLVHYVAVNQKPVHVAFLTEEVFHSRFLHIAQKGQRSVWSVSKHGIPPWCSRVVFTSEGNLLLSGSESKLISYNVNGDFMWEREIKKRPKIMASRHNHNVIMSSMDDELSVYNIEARHLSTFPFPTCRNYLKKPAGICVDSYDYVYIADSEQRSIIAFTPEGRYDRQVLTVDGTPSNITLYADRYVCVVVQNILYGYMLLTYEI